MTTPDPTLAALIPRLRALLTDGFVASTIDERDSSALLRCLAHPLVTEESGDQGKGKRAQDRPNTTAGWIISQRLLAVLPALASEAELLCALLAQKLEVRAAWLAIAAARCKEAGHMSDEGPLLDLVSGLGPAADWVEAALPSAALAGSPFSAFERELLGVSFSQAAATPALVRVLAVAAKLVHFEDALPALPKVDSSGVDAQQNWVKGRLLAFPIVVETSTRELRSENSLASAADQVLLKGGIRSVMNVNQAAMAWVLSQPWALLLAMVGFAQDAWLAEGCGGLLLELPAGQNAFAPTEVAVTIVGREGDEVRCGSLADLLLGMLARLGVACFPQQPTAAELNAQLSPLVGLLLKHSVWRYQDGASSQPGQYQIHPLYSDQCYSLPASRVFNRTGKWLWQAARLAAETLYQEHKQVNRQRSVYEPEAEYVVQGKPIA